ncbi:sigma-70 family RNA polymerase sigma factor [Myxococcota bacterium]|nr:sigma-70 family RNA polymerase sigma factor [Myxococcota bacterium]
MEPCEPEVLAVLARSGDPAALDEATRCYGDRLLVVGRRVCGDPVDAEDAVQAALLSAREHIGEYRGDGRLEAWLRRMVVNACHHMRRGRKNDPEWHDTEAEPPDPTQDPEVQAARGELARALAAALAELTPRDRAIVLLSDVEGWTGPELATRLDVSPASIRTRLARARRRLRASIESEIAAG